MTDRFTWSETLQSQASSEVVVEWRAGHRKHRAVEPGFVSSWAVGGEDTPAGRPGSNMQAQSSLLVDMVVSCRMRARWILMTVIVGVLAGLSGGCGGSPGLAASFDYVVPARFKLPNLQAPEEQGEYEVYADDPLHPDTWLVQLNACPPLSTGSIVK